MFLSPAFAKTDPAGKNRISTSLSRLLIYPSAHIDDELSVRLLLASSTPISSRLRDPKDDLNIPGRELPPSLGDKAGDASTESPPLIGGWIRPIDLAIHDITSSLRSNSSVVNRCVDSSRPSGRGVDAVNVPLLTVRASACGLSPTEVSRSPACTKWREPCALKGVTGEYLVFAPAPVDVEPACDFEVLKSCRKDDLLEV